MRVSRFAEVFTITSGTRISLMCVSLVAALIFAQEAQSADSAAVAWLRDGKVEVRSLESGTAARFNATDKVPLGSLWKLFTFSYLTATHAEEPVYACTQKRRSVDDRYCCTPGESVARNEALARSCAPYFSPNRLGITAQKWQTYWRSQAVAPWLLDVKNLQPETEVTIGELLAALAAISSEGRAEARNALLETGVQGYGREVWTVLGTGIRYKTYSWHLADGRAFGGAAGWLADGTPFWFGGPGSSHAALTAWAAQLAAILPSPRWQNMINATNDTSCVDVDFFARYALRAVWQADQSVQVKDGDLKGRYRLEFANGNWLNIIGSNTLSLMKGADGKPVISGRFTINEYVARVIDREGNTQPPQAARALAIAARTYLLQNAYFEAGCWRITDSSRMQRVSPNPATPAALAAAWFTDEIILSNAAVEYHNDKPGTNRLAWRDAVVQAEKGWDFEHILSVAYPNAGIATVSGRKECKRIVVAENWLANAAGAWQARLRREPGFEPLDAVPKICTLSDGHPYSDQQRLRIYARGWQSLDERLTLAHEYLHLAFRFHPNGGDEAYIERLARRLIEG